MTKQGYREVFDRLPIKSPTLTDLVSFCPHLTIGEIASLFHSPECFVVCPPFRVHGAFHVLQLNDGFSYIGKKRKTISIPEKLIYIRAGRIPASYDDNKHHPDIFNDLPFIVEAIQFAEDNWGEDLVRDTWDEVDCSHSSNVADLAVSPLQVALGFVCMANGIIIDHTVDQLIFREMKGYRPSC